MANIHSQKVSVELVDEKKTVYLKFDSGDFAIARATAVNLHKKLREELGLGSGFIGGMICATVIISLCYLVYKQVTHTYLPEKPSDAIKSC
jgi:hypothetical protein